MYYNHRELVTSVNYKVLTSRVPDILYWKAVENLTRQEFLHNTITLMDPQSHYSPDVSFVAKVNNPTIVTSDYSQVVGHYKHCTEFVGPLFGSGGALTFVGRDDLWPSSKDPYLGALKAYIPYNGKIFEITTQFSVLCCYSIPKLYHYTFPELKWESVSNDPLPPNAFLALPPVEKCFMLTQIQAFSYWLCCTIRKTSPSVMGT